MYTLTTWQPDTLDGFKSTFELEVNDISSYPDDLKSLTGMGGFEKDNVATHKLSLHLLLKFKSMAVQPMKLFIYKDSQAAQTNRRYWKHSS